MPITSDIKQEDRIPDQCKLWKTLPQKPKSNRIEQIRKEIHRITSRKVFLNYGVNTSIKEASGVRGKYRLSQKRNQPNLLTNI